MIAAEFCAPDCLLALAKAGADPSAQDEVCGRVAVRATHVTVVANKRSCCTEWVEPAVLRSVEERRAATGCVCGTAVCRS